MQLILCLIQETTDIPFKTDSYRAGIQRSFTTQYGNTFRVGMGAEAIHELLKNVDLEKEAAKLKEELSNTTSSEGSKTY